MYLKIYSTTLIIILLSFLSFQAQTQKQELFQVEETSISAGAEYSMVLEKAISSGNAEQFMPIISKSGNENSADAITPLLGMDFDSDAALTGWYHIPPDPIGVSGLSHLVAVNNTSIW